MMIGGLWAMVRRGLWRILTRAASALEEVPERAEEESSTSSAPPADWLARVRKGAPQLLEQRGSVHSAQPPRLRRTQVSADARDDHADVAAHAETRAATGGQSATVRTEDDTSVRTIEFTPHSDAPRVHEEAGDANNRAVVEVGERERPSKDESERAIVTPAPRAQLRRPVASSERAREQPLPASAHDRESSVVARAFRLRQPTDYTIRERIIDEAERPRDVRRSFGGEHDRQIEFTTTRGESDFDDERNPSRGELVQDVPLSQPSLRAAALSSHDSALQVNVHWPSLDVPAVASPVRRESALQAPADLNDRWPELPPLPPFMPWSGATHDPFADEGDRLRRVDEEQRGAAWSA